MDVAALSMSLHSAELMRNVGVSLLRKTMDTQEVTAENLIQMIENVPPSDSLIDIRV